MTDADFLKAMHIKPENAPISERAESREPDLTPNVLIDLDEDDLRAAAINWCNQAREQYQENQVLRSQLRRHQEQESEREALIRHLRAVNESLGKALGRSRDCSTFLFFVGVLLLLALIAVCGGQL